MWQQFKNLLFILFSLYLLYSCEKTDDFNKLKVDYNYNGSFSLAIGDTSLNLPHNGYRLPEGWQNYPDSILRRIDSFPLRSEITFSFINPVSRLSYIKRLVLRLDSKNEFPAEIHLRFFFFSDGEILDSLTETIVIPKAVMGTDSTVAQKGEALYDIEILSNHYLKWSTVNNLLVSAAIMNDTSAYKYYKYFNNYKLELHMGFRIDFDFNYNKVL